MFWETYCSLCKERGETPTGVSIKCGSSNASAVKWKNGSIPNGKTLQKIADYFGVSVDYLLCGKKENPTAEKLSDEERMLLELFNQIPKEQQPMVLQMIRAALNSL